MTGRLDNQNAFEKDGCPPLGVPADEFKFDAIELGR